MLCSPVRLPTMWRTVQVSAGTVQSSDAHPGHHNTSPGPARQDFFMNEQAEQRFRQLEIQVRCSASPVYHVLGSSCPCMLQSSCRDLCKLVCKGSMPMPKALKAYAFATLPAGPQ